MNKKSLMGLALAAVVTLSSTSVIAFASQNTEKSTTNVVKVVSNKVNTDKSNVNAQNQDITNDKAIQIAKKALKYYLGVDIETKIKTDGLKVTVDNYKYAKGPIMVAFDKGIDKYAAPEASVAISKNDGKATFVAWRGDRENKEFPYDEAKVKQAAENYIKEKGLDKDIKSITASDTLKRSGVFMAECKYADGSGVDIEFNGKDYSPVLFSEIAKPVKVDAKFQNSNISDEKATQIAKVALKNYLGVDIEQKIKYQNLKTSVIRFDDDIMISFDLSFNQVTEERNKNMAADSNSVTISAKDGIVTSVCGIDGIHENQTYQWDEGKLKETAQKFIKDKGLRTDVQSFKVSEEKKSLSLVSMDCEYADGSKVLLEFNAKDYSVVCFSGYGTIR